MPGIVQGELFFVINHKKFKNYVYLCIVITY